MVEFVVGNRAGSWLNAPAGCILHGSRSGQSYTIDQEYQSTVNYVRVGADGLGWNVTIGEAKICIHLNAREYGRNARQHSSSYLAVEFAQAKLGHAITNRQVANFCWWWRYLVLSQWPKIQHNFPEHYELPAGIADGKTDVDPANPGLLATRIARALAT